MKLVSGEIRPTFLLCIVTLKGCIVHLLCYIARPSDTQMPLSLVNLTYAVECYSAPMNKVKG